MAASLPATCPNCEYATANMDDANRFCPQCRFPLMLVANKYRLLRLLSEGGFGNVYLAHHIHLIEDAARVIKVIRSEVMNQPGMETRFFREVRVTASLSQKNEHIVRIYDDFGDEPQLGYYYVMEYLEGSSLYQMMTEPFDIQQALHIFDQICEAIGEAHRGAVVHRDLKPDNMILLQKRQFPDFVKVLDFGIAKPLKGTIQTRLTQGALGTPFYMSPEQCLAKEVGAASDIYAMGVILYEMLAGQLPFDFEEDAELFAILHAHITQPPRPLLDVRPEVPHGLAEIVHRALAKKPEDRFPSVESLREAAALFIEEDTPYKALTSSSRLRALSPVSQTPSFEQSSPFPFGGNVSPAPPGTRSAPVPAIAAAPLSSGAPSGSAVSPHPHPAEEEAYPGAGTREWKRNDRIAAPTTVTPPMFIAPPPSGMEEVAATTPSPQPVDPRLSQLTPAQAPRKSKLPLVLITLLLLGVGGGGSWYYITQIIPQSSLGTPSDAGTIGASRAGVPTPPPAATPDAATAQAPDLARRVVPPTPPIAAPQPRPRRRRPIKRRRRRRKRRTRPKRRIRPKPRRRKPVVRRRLPPPRIVPRRRPPGRLVAVLPRPVRPRPTPGNDQALQAYELIGAQLLGLFRRNTSRGLQRTLSRQLLQQYKKLSGPQKSLPKTHLYQSVAYIQYIRRARPGFKRMRWMKNPYQTQVAEYQRLMARYNKYSRLAAKLYNYPKSRYYLCAFYFTAAANERMHNLLEDAFHAPLPPPGFRHQMLSSGTLKRQASSMRKRALSTYANGIRFGARRTGTKICLKNLRSRLKRLRRR